MLGGWPSCRGRRRDQLPPAAWHPWQRQREFYWNTFHCSKHTHTRTYHPPAFLFFFSLLLQGDFYSLHMKEKQNCFFNNHFEKEVFHCPRSVYTLTHSTQGQGFTKFLYKRKRHGCFHPGQILAGRAARWGWALSLRKWQAGTQPGPEEVCSSHGSWRQGD